MYISGHLAMGYLAVAGPAVARRAPIDVHYALLPALIGTVTPDAIDKTLRVLEVQQYGRSLGHSLLFLIALYTGWRVLCRLKLPSAQPFGWWGVGVATHLFADLVNDAFRAFEARGLLFTAWAAWPLTDARSFAVDYQVGRHVQIHPMYTSFEIGVLALTAAMLYANWWQTRHRKYLRP